MLHEFVFWSKLDNKQFPLPSSWALEIHFEGLKLLGPIEASFISAIPFLPRSNQMGEGLLFSFLLLPDHNFCFPFFYSPNHIVIMISKWNSLIKDWFAISILSPKRGITKGFTEK